MIAAIQQPIRGADFSSRSSQGLGPVPASDAALREPSGAIRQFSFDLWKLAFCPDGREARQ